MACYHVASSAVQDLQEHEWVALVSGGEVKACSLMKRNLANLIEDLLKEIGRMELEWGTSNARYGGCQGGSEMGLGNGQWTLVSMSIAWGFEPWVRWKWAEESDRKSSLKRA
ncbi:hypothetical protein KSS87_013959 [Heliosperma pusillum]|nr:hypothetical protein KSS87_013959 [Heliosperma pusillum]